MQPHIAVHQHARGNVPSRQCLDTLHLVSARSGQGKEMYTDSAVLSMSPCPSKAKNWWSALVTTGARVEWSSQIEHGPDDLQAPITFKGVGPLNLRLQCKALLTMTFAPTLRACFSTQQKTWLCYAGRLCCTQPHATERLKHGVHNP